MTLVDLSRRRKNTGEKETDDFRKVFSHRWCGPPSHSCFEPRLLLNYQGFPVLLIMEGMKGVC